MRTNKRNIIVVFVFAIILFFAMQYHKNFIYDEELTTLSDANSNFDAWMRTEGKLGHYLRDEIRGENISVTLGNILYAANDVVKNGKQARVFNLEPLEQPVWFTGAEATNWFHFDSNHRRFNYMSVYYSSLIKTDEAPLHSALVHTLTSIFYQNDNTCKWYANSINLVMVFIIMCILFSCCKELGFSYEKTLLTLFLYVSFSGTFRMVIDMRSYTLATMCFTGIAYIHLKWLNALETGKEIPKKYVLAMAGFYLFGAWSNYLVHTLALSIFLVTVPYIWKRYNIRSAIKYALTMMGIVIIAVIPLPMFLSAMIRKATGAGGNGIHKSFFTFVFEGMRDVLIRICSVEWIAVLIVTLIVVLLIATYKRRVNYKSDFRFILLYLFICCYFVVQMIAVKKLSYYIWTVLPLLSIIMIEWLYIIKERIQIDNVKFIRVLACSIGVILVVNVCMEWQYIDKCNNSFAGRKKVAEENSGKPLVVVGWMAKNEDMYFWQYYGDILNCTEYCDGDSLYNNINDERLNVDEIVLWVMNYTEGGEKDYEIDALYEMGFNSMEEVFSNDDGTIYIVRK